MDQIISLLFATWDLALNKLEKETKRIQISYDNNEKLVIDRLSRQEILTAITLCLKEK